VEIVWCCDRCEELGALSQLNERGLFEVKSFKEKEVARAIANVIVQSRGVDNQGQASGAQRVGQLLGIDKAEIERITADLMMGKKSQRLSVPAGSYS
jgi:hypothetical protein